MKHAAQICRLCGVQMGFPVEGTAVNPIDGTGVRKGWTGDACERGYCTQCYMLKMLSEINPDVWTEIDPLIFENDRFTGLKRLREILGIRLIDARFIFGTRYRILRENNSNGFYQPHEEYWEGVYE